MKTDNTSHKTQKEITKLAYHTIRISGDQQVLTRNMILDLEFGTQVLIPKIVICYGPHPTRATYLLNVIKLNHAYEASDVTGI